MRDAWSVLGGAGCAHFLQHLVLDRGDVRIPRHARSLRGSDGMRGRGRVSSTSLFARGASVFPYTRRILGTATASAAAAAAVAMGGAAAEATGRLHVWSSSRARRVWVRGRGLGAVIHAICGAVPSAVSIRNEERTQ